MPECCQCSPSYIQCLRECVDLYDPSVWDVGLYYDYEHDNHTWSSVFNRISLYILSTLPVSKIDIQPSNDALKMMQIPHIGL